MRRSHRSRLGRDRARARRRGPRHSGTRAAGTPAHRREAAGRSVATQVPDRVDRDSVRLGRSRSARRTARAVRGRRDRYRHERAAPAPAGAAGSAGGPAYALGADQRGVPMGCTTEPTHRSGHRVGRRTTCVATQTATCWVTGQRAGWGAFQPARRGGYGGLRTSRLHLVRTGAGGACRWDAMSPRGGCAGCTPPRDGNGRIARAAWWIWRAGGEPAATWSTPERVSLTGGMR